MHRIAFFVPIIVLETIATYMNIIKLFTTQRPSFLAQLLLQRVFNPSLSGFNKIESFFADKTGIEIGGPSNMFKSGSLMPVYPLAKKIDGCNFSSHTEWEGEIKEGETYQYESGKYGHQFICDGVDVPIIPKHKYEFVLSCNNLEHIANPLKAVNNWIQLLQPEGGVIVLILPKKEANFDHRRPTTTFQHLLNDYENNIGEDDLTALEEVLKYHDLRLDPLAGGKENFRTRSEDNFNNRCLHHHVYDMNVLEAICNYFKLDVLFKETRVTDYIIVGKKFKGIN